ncbi:hypothetical protein [Candidatus Formimonas warabiya]|uniref:Uncharacterized protein n=1 Tax=Formimonas warabiya TaxID=1761012 RepID=A0A3G1KRU8_FORW1|nr:hypothetical protein [Candidatus Formimonas warabiya]ATW25213.1 hypothetical protein DCMF_10935 [Candidatus Formimonas warabiya]
MNRYAAVKHYLFAFMLIMAAVYEAGGIIDPVERLALLKNPGLLSQHPGIQLMNIFYLIGLFFMLFRHRPIAFALFFLSLVQGLGPQTSQRIFIDAALCFLLLITVLSHEVIGYQKNIRHASSESED